jgi:hypothetical protein
MLPSWLDFSASAVGNIANMIAALAAATGLLLTAWTLRAGNFQRRVRIVSDALSSLYEDDHIREIYYKIDYSSFEYDPTKFHGSEEERKLDHLLAKLNILAKQYEIGLIQTSDLEIMRYEYLMVHENEEVQKYLTHLDGWFKTKKLTTPPFHSFRQLGQVLREQGQTTSEPRSRKRWFTLRSVQVSE